MRLFYSSDYTAASASFDTTRKSGWIAESLSSNPIPGVDIVAPTPLTFQEIAEVHDPVYVKSIRRGEPKHLAESQGFTWDPGMWKAVTASNGGVVAAANAAMTDGVSGSLSSGLHHVIEEDAGARRHRSDLLHQRPVDAAPEAALHGERHRRAGRGEAEGCARCAARCAEAEGCEGREGGLASRRELEEEELGAHLLRGAFVPRSRTSSAYFALRFSQIMGHP